MPATAYGFVRKPFVRVGRARRRRKTLPRQLEPKAIEVAYAKELRAFVNVCREAVKQVLLPALPQLLEQAAVERGDAWNEDASGRQVRALMGRVRETLSRAVSNNQLERLAEDMSERTSRYQKQQLDKQVRASLGVDVFAAEPNLGPLSEAFVEANVALIKSLPEQTFTQVESLVQQAVRGGARHEQLAEDIAGRFEVAESRAALIARDQTLKFYGEVNKARQSALGVEAYIWRATPDNRTRPEHEERDGKRYLWAEPPADGHPGMAINCFPGDVRVSVPTPVLKAYRRRYSGELTTLVTDSGEAVRATPNHPVLTQRGWLPVHLVNVGDYLIKTRSQRVELEVGDPQGRDETLEQLFSALSLLGAKHRVAGPAVRFHGDVSDEEVDVVDADWSLGKEVPALLSQEVCNDVLSLADQPGLSPGPFGLLFGGEMATTNSSVRGFCKLATLIWRGDGHPNEHGFTASAWLDAATAKLRHDGRSSHAKVLSQLFHAPSLSMESREEFTRILFGIGCRVVAPSDDAALSEGNAERVRTDAELARDVSEHRTIVQETSRVVEKRVSQFSGGHVYNLETVVGWYGAENHIVHNCRCSGEPDLESLLGQLEGGAPEKPEPAPTRRPRRERARPPIEPAVPPRPPAQEGTARPSIDDIPVGKPLRKAVVEGRTRTQFFDYTHALSAKNQAAGYKARVEVDVDRRPGDRPLVWYRGRAKDADGVQGAVLNAEVQSMDGIRYLYIQLAEVSEGHGGRRLGQEMVEAAIVDARARHGITEVRGSVHSTTADAMHKRLSEKYGWYYHAEYASPEAEKRAEGPFDGRFGPYQYSVE